MQKKRELEELIQEAKDFFETHKKKIGESIRENKKVIQINFEELAEHSHEFAEELLSGPEEMFQVL